MPTKTIETFAARDSLIATKSELAIFVPLTIKSGFKALRGAVLGVITASGLGRRRTRATAAGAGFGTGTAIGRVVDASVFAAGDVLKNVAGTTIGTVQSVDITTTPHTITLTGNAAVAVAAAADVLGSDGSQVAKAISDDATDGVGDTTLSVLIAGPLVESKLVGLDDSAKSELAGRSTIGGIFIF